MTNLPAWWAALQTRLRNRTFLRNSGLLMLANIIVTGLALIRTPAMTWLLPKAEYGMIGVVGAWLPFIQLLSLPGMDTAAYHYVAKGQPWAYRVNLAYRRRWSLPSVLGLLLGACFWWWQGESTVAWLFVVAGLSYPFTTALTAAGGMLGATENFVGLFWYRLGESLTDFVGFIPLLVGVWWVSQGVTFYGFSQLATALMLMGLSWWLLKQFARTTQDQAIAKPTAEQEQEMVRYSWQLTRISALGVTQSQIDLLLVGTFLSLLVTADYAIASIVSNQLKTLWNVYMAMRYPPLVRMTGQRRRQRFVREGVLVYLGFVGVAGVAFVMAALLIPRLLPASYATSVPYIGWLILTFLLMLPGALFEMYFRMEQAQQRQYNMRLGAMLATVLVSLLLITRWQVAGVIAGRAVGAIVFSALGWWLFTTMQVVAPKPEKES